MIYANDCWIPPYHLQGKTHNNGFTIADTEDNCDADVHSCYLNRQKS